MKHRDLLIIGTVAMLLFGAACEKKAANTNGNTNDEDYAPVVINLSDDDANVNSGADDDNNNSNGNTNTTTNANSNSNSNTNTSANKDDAVSGTLSVSDPETDKGLESPFTVEGKSAADNVYVSVVSKSGVTLFTVPVTVRNGAFKASITFDFSNTTDGSVKVFEKDADENATNAVNIAVTFKSETSDDSDTNTNSNSNANTDDGY